MRALIVILLCAAVGGGAYWFHRESEARRCRAAVVAMSESVLGYGESYGARGDAAVRLAGQLSARKARDCYVRGLLD